MFNDSEDAKWNAEFRELGVKRVRELMLGTSWDKDKKRWARLWLEKQDVLAWQAKRPATADPDKVTFKQRIRQYRWLIMLVGGLAFALMGLRRFF